MKEGQVCRDMPQEKIPYVPNFAESLRVSLFSAKPLEPWKQKLSLLCNSSLSIVPTSLGEAQEEETILGLDSFWLLLEALSRGTPSFLISLGTHPWASNSSLFKTLGQIFYLGQFFSYLLIFPFLMKSKP